MQEPGLERHEWESELQGLETELEDDARAALPALADLVERMLRESGYDLDDPVARSGESREVVAEYLAAREVSDGLERGDEAYGPGDVGAAVAGLRDVAGYLLQR